MAKVTLRDVAEAAGVSIATASWAVNDNRDVRITESTRRKVRRAADELGYHHNALARGLARGRSDIIGFISDGVATSPFAGQVIQGAQDEAWRNGKILLVVDTDGRKDVERRTFSFMFEHQVEGIIGLEADDGRPETSPDTGARRNSQNKDSSSKKLSNTPLPIHRCPQVQARKQRRRPPLRHDATRRCRGRRRGCRRNRGAGSQRTIRGLTEATETALRRDDSSGRTTIRPGPRRLSSFFSPRRAWQRPCANGSNR